MATMYPGITPYGSYNNNGYPVYSFSSTSQNTPQTQASAPTPFSNSVTVPSSTTTDYSTTSGTSAPSSYAFAYPTQQVHHHHHHHQQQQQQQQQQQAHHHHQQQQVQQQQRQVQQQQTQSGTSLPPLTSSSSMYYYPSSSAAQGYYTHASAPAQMQYGLHSQLSYQQGGPLTSNTSPNPSGKPSFSSDSSISSVSNSVASRYAAQRAKNSEPPARIYKSVNNQSQISSHEYIPSDPNIDITEFTEEDLIVLKNLLPLAEIHKWKYISNRLSKLRSKKLNTDYTIKKFHEMSNLPFNPQNSLLNSNYFLQLNKEAEKKQENFEGLLGSSIPYILCKDGWNYID